MKIISYLITVLILMAGAAYGGFYYATHYASVNKDKGEAESETPTTSPTTEPAEEHPVATVTEGVIEQKTISTTLSVFGSASATPDRLVIVPTPFECVINKLLVTSGQSVKKGDAVAEISPSQETILSYQEAKDAYDAAQADLKQAQQRYEMKLATGQELLTSQTTFRSSKLRFDSMEQRHVSQAATLVAPQDGVVAKLDVQCGQTATQSTALVEILPAGQGVVTLGVDSSYASSLKEGQAVTVNIISGKHDPIEGKIGMVSNRINPETRLIEVRVILPADTDLPMDTYVKASITLESKDALVVPRSAVLPNETGYEIFTVVNDHAVPHEVKLGLETETEYQILSADLHAGDVIITQGNYEVEDNMQVTTEKK